MSGHLFELEVFIAFNVLLFMLLFSFITQTVGKQLGLLVGWLCVKYFEEKAKYLTSLSKLDVPDKVGKFN
jgi:hypothetical protein